VEGIPIEVKPPIITLVDNFLEVVVDDLLFSLMLGDPAIVVL
jgi:hypothetical protein